MHVPNSAKIGQSVAQPPANRISWDMANTLERLGGDESLLQEVIDIFLDDAPKHMDSLRNAITDNNPASVEQAAHTLKGELGYLGVSDISQKARELEEAGRNADLVLAASLYANLKPQLSELLAVVRSMAGTKPRQDAAAKAREL
jgi:two-component system sensor histidine kinase/response regulator